MSRRYVWIWALLFLLGWPAISRAAEKTYDVVIRGGKIVDGTGNPWFYGDVAVRGDRIVAIGRVPEGSGRSEIDARGLVVAPGFIDMHSHSDYVLLEGMRSRAEQVAEAIGPWTPE